MPIVNSLTIGWCFVIVILTKQLYGRWFNPCLFMNLIWCICSICSTFGWFDFYKPSIKTQLYILFYLVTYSVFSLIYRGLFQHVKIRKNQKNSLVLNNSEIKIADIEKPFDINVKILLVLYLVFMLMIFPLLIKSLDYILVGDLKTMRTSFLQEGVNYAGKFTVYLYNYIIRAYFIFLNLLAAYALGNNHQKRWKILALALLGSITHALITGGRMIIFELICYIIISFMAFKPKKSEIVLRLRCGKFCVNISKRLRIWLLVLIPAAGGIVLITSLRLYFGQGIIGTFWQYSVGPIGYLNLIIQNPKMFGIDSNSLLFGKMTFGFITGPIDTFLSAVWGSDYNGADYLANLYVEKFYRISPTVKLNATCTILYPFLRDWGIVGLIIGPAIVALIVESVYYESKNVKNSFAWDLVLISIYYMILFSVWRYTLMAPATYMSYVWILVIGYTVRVKSRRSSRKGADSLSGKIYESS